MKTLLESTDTSATYQFINGTAARTVVYTKPEDAEETPDFEAMATAEYEAWLQWVGEAAPAPSPLDQAEAHIGRYFSTPRLLQMKVWWDAFAHESTPKLASVYDWTNSITIAAAQGQTNFTAPPHSFEELVAEAMVNLGVQS